MNDEIVYSPMANYYRWQNYFNLLWKFTKEKMDRLT